MFGNIGWGEGIALVAILLLLFGARRLPEMMRSMGQGVREFKKAVSGIGGDDDNEDSQENKAKQES